MTEESDPPLIESDTQPIDPAEIAAAAAAPSEMGEVPESSDEAAPLPSEPPAPFVAYQPACAI